MMNGLATAEHIAERLRREPYDLFRNDCISKSVRLKRECRAMGIDARVVICLGLARAKWFGRWTRILVVHSWGEVEKKRLETSRPLGSSGIWSIVPMNIRPIWSLRF